MNQGRVAYWMADAGRRVASADRTHGRMAGEES